MWGIGVVTSFKFVASSVYKKRFQTNRWELSYTGSWGFNRISIISFISNTLESCQHQKIVQNHQNILNPLLDKDKCGPTFKALVITKYWTYYKNDSSTVVLLKISQWISMENVPLNKKDILAFGQNNLVCCYSRPNSKYKL